MPTRLFPASTRLASPCGCDADDAAAAVEAGGHVDAAVARQRQSLGTAQAAIPCARVSVGIDGPDGVVGRERGTGDEEHPRAVHRQVIRRHARLQRGMDEDFAVRVDFEDGSAAVAHEKIALAIEGSAR